MQFRNIVLAAAALSLVAGSAFAQNGFAQQAAPHKADAVNSTKATASNAKDGQTAKAQMSAQELKQRLDKGEKIVIVDARHELNGEIIKGAVHVPSDKLEAWAKDVNKKTVIVTYCTCPHDEAAEEEVRELNKMGFVNVYSLTGGMSAARKAGIEVVATT
jgi:rhodanese-related sulfurtransferase